MTMRKKKHKQLKLSDHREQWERLSETILRLNTALSLWRIQQKHNKEEQSK